jgi:large subunit ribosomal protein L15
MQLHDVRTASLCKKRRVRVGRGVGSGIGKTCGRGREGATSRSGWAMKATYEGGQMPLFRRLPKRGFTNGPFRVSYAEINVEELSSFPAQAKVGPEELRKAGLLRGNAKLPVKVLGEGELTVALTVVADKFSASAREKIEKAGGKVEWLGGAPDKKAPNFVRIKKLKDRQAAISTAKEEASKAVQKAPAKGDSKSKPQAKASKAPGGGDKKKDVKDGGKK